MQGVEVHLHTNLKISTSHIPENKGVLPLSLSAIYRDHKASPPIEDPLWELVCTKTFHLMGSAARPIRNCQPGTISHQNEFIDLNCQTEEAIQFGQQFDFIILGILKQYFPALKEVRVKRITYKAGSLKILSLIKQIFLLQRNDVCFISKER